MVGLQKFHQQYIKFWSNFDKFAEDLSSANSHVAGKELRILIYRGISLSRAIGDPDAGKPSRRVMRLFTRAQRVGLGTLVWEASKQIQS